MIRRSNDIPRDTFTPEELANLAISFYKRNYIEGLFLSSGIFRSADHTMEQMLRCVKLLRLRHWFNGYIHMKIIPGADQRLVDEAGRFADRLSVNVELPSEKSLSALAPQKDFKSIFRPMGRVAAVLNQAREDRKKRMNPPVFAPAGQSTQVIIGASPETDLHILRGSAALYSRMNLKRVYYSAFVPVNKDKRLPGVASPPLLREHRLYQSDWLLRFYGFRVEEILDEKNPNLSTELDPKAGWALRNLHLFPVEINTADRQVLLRVPGLGIRTVEKILSARRRRKLSDEDLKKMRISLKRAKYFLTVRGRYQGGRFDEASIRAGLLGAESPKKKKRDDQLLLFPEPVVSGEDFAASVTGEL
jgi:putative DNA modification/repair radical SAM protein